MKNKILIISILILIILIVVTIIIFKHQNKNIEFGIKGTDATGIKLKGNEQIEKLIYTYAGTYIGGIYTYEIYKEEDDIKLKVEYMNINEDNPDIITIDNNSLDRIMELVKKHKANNWDGYDKYATDILDGSGFSMTIKLTNGKSISFSGTNCAPKGYYAFEKEVLELINDDINIIKKKYNL